MKFNESLYLEDMYNDDYFPKFMVDKVKMELAKVVDLLECGERDMKKIQAVLDEVTIAINDLQEEFEENDSEIETVARDSIGVTVGDILDTYGIDLDVDEAIRKRDW